jgi:hypothetical protein
MASGAAGVDCPVRDASCAEENNRAVTAGTVRTADLRHRPYSIAEQSPRPAPPPLRDGPADASLMTVRRCRTHNMALEVNDGQAR